MTHRSQQLNSDKSYLTNLRDGIKYLGYELKQVDSSKQPLQLYAEPTKNWGWIAALKQLENSKFLELEKPHSLAPFLPNNILIQELASVNSRVGSLVHCQSYLFRKESIELFIKKTTTPLGVPKDFSDPWCPFKFKKSYRAVRLR